MSTATRMLAIEDEDGPVCESSVDDFVSANETLTDEDLADVSHLAVGDKLRFGGGAAPVFEVKRVA